MTYKCFIMAIMVFVLIPRGACTKKMKPPLNGTTEFTFPGGTFKDGKIMVGPSIKVEKDTRTRSVILRPVDGGAKRISCSCILAAGGSCFPDTQTPIGSNPTVIVCVSTGCGPGGEPFCLMESDDPEGGDSAFNFKVLVKARVSTEIQ